jgi:hypothetical protein
MYAIRVRNGIRCSGPPGLLFRSNFSPVRVWGRYETCHSGVFVANVIRVVKKEFVRARDSTHLLK